MPISEARVRTERASRYLTQLCNHGSKMRATAFHRVLSHRGRGAAVDSPPAGRHARSTGEDGVIDFGWGRCTLQATAEELILTAEAEDEPGLRRIQDGIAARLQRIGHRDRLTVVWTRRTTQAETQNPVND